MGNLYNLKKGYATPTDLAGAYGPLFASARNIFYVDADHSEAADTNEGTDPNYPLATIAGGYARCTDGLGEVIFVKGIRRYRENQLTILKDGVCIIGAGYGTEWNRTSSQTGTYVCAVEAKNVKIMNIQISVNGAEPGLYIGDGGATVSANAAECLIENCFIRGNWYSAAGSEGTTGITVDGASFGPIIKNNTIWGWGTGIDISDGAAKTTYGCQIMDNVITGKTYGINWSSGYGYTSIIAGNYIWDWKASVNLTGGIALADTVGGVLVANNFIGAANACSDTGDLNYWVGNAVRITEATSETVSLEMEAHA